MLHSAPISASSDPAKNVTKSKAVLPRFCGTGLFNQAGVSNACAQNDPFWRICFGRGFLSKTPHMLISEEQIRLHLGSGTLAKKISIVFGSFEPSSNRASRNLTEAKVDS